MRNEEQHQESPVAKVAKAQGMSQLSEDMMKEVLERLENKVTGDFPEGAVKHLIKSLKNALDKDSPDEFWVKDELRESLRGLVMT